MIPIIPIAAIATAGILKNVSVWRQERKSRNQATVEQAELAAQKAAAMENARRFCEDCGTELSQEAAFCHQCGGSRKATRGAIREREMAEEQRKRLEQWEKDRQKHERIAALRVSEEQAKKRRILTEAARKRCREIASRRYCPECRAEREATHKYCITCRRVVGPIPPAMAFERAHDEFPEIVCTEDDFNRFVK